MTKYDRHGYKPRERILTLSNQAIYLHDAKDMKLKHKILLKDLTGMTITNMGDGLLLLRIPPEIKQLKVRFEFVFIYKRNAEMTIIFTFTLFL